jgi:hypothetical protein
LLSWAWWFTPVIPALRRLRQEDLKLKASLGFIMSSQPIWVTNNMFPQTKQKMDTLAAIFKKCLPNPKSQTVYAVFQEFYNLSFYI